MTTVTLAAPRSWHRYRPLLTLAALYVGVGLVLRGLLWVQFGRPGHVPAGALGWLLPVGAINDAAEAAYLLFPFSLYLWLLPDRGYRSRANQWLLTIGGFLTAFAIVYLAPVEYYFFEEFDARFNLVATDYLIYPHEVFNDIWESYPVARVVVLAGLLALALCSRFRRDLRAALVEPTRLKDRAAPFAIHAALLCLLVLGLRTDSLAHSGNRIAGQIGVNGHSQFFQALRTNEIDYHAYYLTEDPRAALQRLTAHLGGDGGRFERLDAGRLDRSYAATPTGLGKLNVVVVMEESLGAEFSRLHGSRQDLTPNLDRYAQQGLWFSRMYAQGTRTVRGLEAISSSFPPIPTVSIVRRPNNEHIATWGKVMREAGYSTTFLYGGFGVFDNMNAFFAGNGYEVIDRRDIRHERFANIWGVSDEDLFDTALATFDRKAARGQPFFAQIMTTSNHKPFTFRAGVPGVPVAGGGRDAGVRYADYALGYFLEQARHHPWFDRTLFVIVADHGARVYGRAQIPLKTYEIPCLIWAPEQVRPQRVDVLASQIDVAPTVLGLLGFGYRAPFFGQNLLTPSPRPRVVLFQHNHDVALYTDDRLVVLGMQRQVAEYAYDRAADAFHRLAPEPAMQSLAVAYFQTASDLFEAHRYE